MSKKILGDITVTAPSKIYSELLAVKLCYLNDKGLREEASIISSKVFKDCSYIIEYEAREIDQQQEYYVEITYADLHLRSVNFCLDPSMDPFTFDPLSPNEEQPEELPLSINLSDLDYFIEITGSVKTTRGMYCPDVSMQCNQISLSNSVTLDEVMTNEKGNYAFVLEQPFEPLIEKINPIDISNFKTDFDIQIVADDQNLPPVVYSDIFFDVKNNIEYDFVLGNEKYVGLSNVAKQKAAFENISSFETNTPIPIEQVDYISSKMGISTDAATLFINAKNMGIKFSCDEDIMYALLNGNMNADYTTLLFKTNDELLEKINNAIDNNIIYLSKVGMENQIEALKAAMITEYIQEPNFISKYETIDVLTNNDKEDIVLATIEWMNNPELQHSNITLNDYLLAQELLSPAQYDKAVLYDGITNVSNWNTKLSEKIIETFSSWTRIDDVIAGNNEILQIITQNSEIAIPEQFTTAEEYAQHIDNTLEKEYPSQYLKNEICKIENETFLKNTEIEIFLNNNPDFQFGNNHALVTLEKPEIILNGIDTETLKIDLQKVEQLFQLTPLENKSEIMEILWNLSLTSAHQIAFYSEDTFKELIEENLPNDADISIDNFNRVYNQSVTVAATTEAIMNELITSGRNLSTTVIPGYNYDGATEDNQGLPTIKDLFGSQDYFQYPDSRTLLSPAAYLMDLLQFLRSTDKDNAKITELFKRRPDIEHILLNCSNTDNIMPHIDLVNEILEVVTSEITEPELTEYLKELQTRWNTNDLVAYPENTSQSYLSTVYNKLKNAKVPWSLPFYFYLEEYRSYLKQLSLSREELIKYFTSNTINATENIEKELYEFLGLNENDIEIITASTPISDNDLEEFYNGTIPSGNVHELIALTGLSYDEINELLTSYYINPVSESHRYVLYTIPGNDTVSPYLGSGQTNGVKPGTLEGTFILKTGGSIDPSPNKAFYDRLHRFERLCKKLNLKVHELDLIFNYLETNTITSNDLCNVAYILKIKKMLNLKLEETLLLCNSFKFNAYPNYVNRYDYLFIRKTENYALKEDFEKLKDSTTDFSDVFIYSEIPTILSNISGLKISENSYNTILSGEQPILSGTPTIEGLSQICRVSILCKSLNITEEEYYFLKQISSLNDLKDAENLMKFINYVHQIRSYGFTIADLAYILSDKKIKGATITLDDEKIIDNLRELQKDLRKIKMEEEILYEKYISENLQNEFKTDIDEAINYIFSNFDASDPNSQESDEVTTFINKHPDIFCSFQELLPDGSGMTLQEFFLENGNDPAKKVNAVLVGLQLENELSSTDSNNSKGKYCSEQELSNLFMNIKSHVALEIINGTHNFDITLKDSFLDANHATEYDIDAVIETMDNSKENLADIKRTKNLKNKNKNQSKYAEFTDGKKIKLNINVEDFITNNNTAFPADANFLKAIDNSQSISGDTKNYKKFVFAKNMAVPEEKIANLRNNLSKYLDEIDLDAALNIILKPDQPLSDNDPESFIREKFDTFTSVSEALNKLYKFEPNNNQSSSDPAQVEYLENYCDRVDFVLECLTRDQLVDTIITHLMSLCNINEEYMREFLFTYFSYDTNESLSFASDKVAAIFGFLSNDFIENKINSTDHAQFILLCQNMYKLALCVNTFRIPQKMLDDIFKILYAKEYDNENFGIINIFELSFPTSDCLKKYLNLATSIGISHTYFTEEQNFFKFFQKNGLTQNLSYISKITGCKETDLDTLNSNVLPTTKLYHDWFIHLLECQRIISFLGVTAQTILDLHTIDENSIDENHIEKLRQIVKNKYPESEWDKISADLRDPLRIKQRDALRDYLILNYDKDNVTFKSSNDLFNYFLIDTEMIPMAKTSRIIQATLSVQLFIQRILMGMENGLSFTSNEKEELIWRRNYRVWEANRKILFFPENWLDPELRHDKTEIFKSIEEKLLQNDIDDNTVLQAYYDYAEKLEEVANLEILAAYRPYSANKTNGNFIAFVGKTQGSPHKYFYRTLKLSDGGGIWTPWEEITNGIKTDMVKLAYWKGSMYMFWTEIYITKETSKLTSDTNAEEESTAIKMAWSRYKNGKWSKAVFCDEVYIEPSNDNRQTTNIHLGIVPHDNRLDINIYYFIAKSIYSRFYFIFNGALLYLKSNDEEWTEDNKMITDFGDLEVFKNKAVCNGEDETKFKLIYYPDKTGPNKELTLFNNKNIPYNILYEDMCYDTDALLESNSMEIANYIKPLILEDKCNGKSYLGIPYNPYKKSNPNSQIKILNKEIKNLKYLFMNFYHPYIDDIKERIQEGYQKLFDSIFHDIDITGKKGSVRRLKFDDLNFIKYYGSEKSVVDPTPFNEELAFGKYTKIRLIDMQSFALGLDVVLDLVEDSNDGNDNAPYGGGNHHEHYFDGETIFEEEEDISYTKNIPAIDDPYSIYNWEMFYHIPMLIADNLSRNMRFEEAQKWYHLVFDPTIGGNEKGAKKYWKIKPFRVLFNYAGNLIVPMNIQDFIYKVNKKNYNDLIDEWKTNPFNPHLVATNRTLSYMQYVVRKYLENIIAWADMYFTKDTREDINQAALLYILAAEILGVRPQKLEGTLPDEKSYSDLKDTDDPLSNIFIEIEGILTVMADHFETQGGVQQGVTTTTYSVSYFGAPHNDKMEECWDIVADRLFKIRNCMNIQGVVRELPLTSPPIDPGLIAAAMAAGADLSTALSTLSAPLPLYRFTYMLQKAIDFANDVKALGNSLLSVLEKCDAEELSILRSTHERAILNAMTAIREKAIEEATKNIEALENSKVAVASRKDYYKNKKKIYPDEQKALDLHKQADSFNERAADLAFLSSILGITPQLSAGFPGGVSLSFGGLHLSIITNALAAKYSANALKKQNNARETDTKVSYERRYEDWVFQGDQADKEIKQIDKQIIASRVRLAMAEKELENHVQQIELKIEEFEFMKEKFTNKQLYNWMKGQVSKLYQQAYQMAHKLALAAEKAFLFEKQREGYSKFITSAYWDNLKEGLMSGELLYQDLRRLEMEYMETNEREIELTKDISLAMIDPYALNELRTTGKCDFEIPEMLYDIDHPGHYLRRIKSVSISIPAVTGPYSGVTCKLSMLNNRFRKSIATGSSGYAYKGMEDTRFEHNIIGIQSIATSTGNNDSGMFEFNFKDERYLPFEGAGAIGSWGIEMPNKVRKFNYATIADVILHVKYTAKDAGGMLKEKAEENITDNFNSIMSKLISNEAQLIVAHNIKTEFSDVFQQLCEEQTCSLTIERKHLPFMVVDYARREDEEITITEIEFTSANVSNNFTVDELTDAGITIELSPSAPISEQEDIYMIIRYKIG